MESYLNYDVKTLDKNNAYWTAKEICQQPLCWEKTFELVNTQRQSIDAFLNQFKQHSQRRIILTGAGTSAFAGKAVMPILSSYLQERVEAIATTDLVSNPRQYFAENIPTLLISFARSGNSPESVAAVELANKCLSNCYHLVLTCNKDGKLNQLTQQNTKKQAFTMLMPEETNDKSFAMTSSFSSMMMACLSIFLTEVLLSKEIESICKQSVDLFKEFNLRISNTLSHEVDRVIYLGSGCFQGLAQEAALKLLELTAGKVVGCFDSTLGFRHGPKSIVDKNTYIVVFISNDDYTRKYDLDILTELRRDNIAKHVIAIGENLESHPENISISNEMGAKDFELLFPYLIYAQIYAFQHSLLLNLTPDNPCPTGEVNRVVQGVTIYELNH